MNTNQGACSPFQTARRNHGNPYQRWNLPDVERKTKVNILEAEDNYELQLSLPGLNREDVTISQKDNILSLKADKPFEKKEGYSYHRLEFKDIKLDRKFELPSEVDMEGITANMKDGILTIELPKRAKEEYIKNIEIK